MKPFCRRAVNACMAALLVLLIAYPVTGQAAHEWLGIALLALFAIHHLRNRRWFAVLRKGKYPALRLLQTLLVFLLLLSVSIQIFSGAAMSRYAVPFLDLPVTVSLARRLHLACGYWSFFLASIHWGLHGKMAGKKGLQAAEGILAVYGAACFFRQDIFSYLFLRTEFAFFDYQEPPALALAELSAMMMLGIQAGRMLRRAALRGLYAAGGHEV